LQCHKKKIENTTAVTTKKKVPFVWEAAVYFLMTDRFNNGDKLNDLNYNRIKTAGKCVDLK
jgi:alpha-amylase